MAEVQVMPQLGNTVESCLITAWRVEVGQTVDPSTVLCEIETDKSAMEVPAGFPGVVLARLAEVGDEVPVKAPLAVIGQPGEDVSSWTGGSSPALAEPAPEPAPAIPGPAPTVGSPAALVGPDASPATVLPTALAAAGAPPVGPAGGPVGVGLAGPKAASPRARELAAVYNVAIDGLVGSGPKGRVIERDVLAAAVGQGSAAACPVVPAAETPPPAEPDRAVLPADQTAALTAAAPSPAVAEIPLTRAAQAQAQTDGASVSAGSGVGGRVRLADLIGRTARSQPIPASADPALPSDSVDPLTAVAPLAPTEPARSAPAPSAVEQTSEPAASGPVEEASFPGPIDSIPLRGIRQLVAERMRASLSHHAQLTFDSSAPATNLINLRARLKQADPALGMTGVTIGDLVAYAAVQTLSKHGGLNATLTDGALNRYAEVHLGLAVDTPRGLLVPTVRFASRLSLRQFSGQTKALAGQAQSGSVSPDLLSGATFTVTNLGAFGIESFTPILNSPQVAILGVNTIRPQPLPLSDGGWGVEQRIGFSLTVDHAVVDGADAARFLADLVALVTDIDIAVLD
ncbi:MAG: 2-oxo acid dehydrogenase subunit E2 [Propionibacteriaceae bacterium]|jgi:pyruvate dehydrogenase E2 component (dihydrolipoamide acetyltransferase)|nr:2-oxo acid dehydrogenase subunit E2 [Propionibacteriaceae bacterium]